MQSLIDRNPIWFEFYELTKIPRPSKHEEKISAYLLDWACRHGIEAQKDRVGNILYKVSGTPGHETDEPLTLQAHMDMVCEKNSDVVHDFMTDSIPVYVDGGWVRSRGTTLGADDGIGIATALAIVSEGQRGKLQHAPLYCLFTVDEETGLTGASNLHPDFLPSRRLINLDSEDEGQIFIGCAGGCTTTAIYDVERKQTADGMLGIRATLRGLQGGHSGGDIHLGRANAIKLMARFAQVATERCGLQITTFDGGNLHNAIAREATLTGAIPFAQKENLRVEFNVFLAGLHDEYKGVENNIDFDFETTRTPTEVFTPDFQERLLGALLACPHGVLAMHHDIENLVMTSTNLASVKQDTDSIKIVTSQRSSLETGKQEAQMSVSAAFRLSGARVETSEGYPGWTPDLGSPLLKLATEAYRKLFGTDAKVLAIHAGLECGLFAGKKQGLDMISVGPTLRAVHSPDEAADIESVDKFWVFIKEIVK